MSVRAETLGYELFRFSPRAPRVAVVVRGGGSWRFWARLALHGATMSWGGAGFVVVPHEDGVVHPAVLRAVGVYDPDCVMVHVPSLADVEAVSPGETEIIGGDGVPLGAEERARAIAGAGGASAPDVWAEAARKAVVSACSPYRRWDAAAGVWDADELWWTEGGVDRGRLLAATRLGVSFDGALAAAPGLAGDVGVAAAARAGLVARPSAGGSGDGLDEDVEAAAAAWLLGGGGLPPAAVAAVPAWRGPETAFERGSAGLAKVSAVGRRPPVFLAAGDTAADFALALLWDRVFGRGVWLPRAWWPTGAGRLGATTRAVLGVAAERGTEFRLGSASASEDELRVLGICLRSPDHVMSFDGERRPARERKVLVGGAWPRGGMGHLAVQGQFDQSVAIPVRRDGDGGGFEMAAPAPPPLVTAPALAGVHDLVWEVDLQPDAPVMPTGRGIDGHALVMGEQSWPTWVRSGRDGVSYNAQRYDLVLSGSSAEARLARPRLRHLDLLGWANALGRPDGQSYRLSDAGLRVGILARMAGGRAPLVDMLGGRLRPALRAFNTRHKATSVEYPGKEGVVLPDGGYLNLGGIASLAGVAADKARGLADPAVAAGILRRGLILGCGSCQRPSFVPVGRLGQRNECPRCGQANDLVQERWRDPVDEPVWFYDLHPAARELFAAHGDVPLLLSAHLRKSSRRYADIAEIELVGPSGPEAESDLLSHANGRVAVAEAKSNDRLGETKAKEVDAARKRAVLAAALRADEVILATTAAQWAPSSVAAMKAALVSASWPRGGPPDLRLVTGLGGAAPGDETVAV